jgi:hypothetical protein
MKTIFQFTALLAIALLATALRAQDPFADPPAAGAPAAAAPAAEDPFGAGAAPGAPGGKPGPEIGVDLTKVEPLVIRQLRESNPTTPAEILRAALATWQFGRPDESKRYLAKLLASMPADEALAELETEYADFLFTLAREEPLQPEGKQVSDAIIAAAQKLVQNPDRMNALIAQLSDPDLGVRMVALEDLRKSGPAVVTPMLRVLADSARESEHRYLRAALAHMKVFTELPMLGALEVPNDYLKAQVIIVLGRMDSQRATMHLVRPAVDPATPAGVRDAAAAALTRIVGKVPSRYEAERYLAQETARLLTGTLPYQPDPDDNVVLWYWDESRREVLPLELPRGDAAVLLAARTANDLYALKASGRREPGSLLPLPLGEGRGEGAPLALSRSLPLPISPAADSTNRALRLKLLTSLELAKVLAGIDQPLPMSEGTAGAEAVAAGPQVMSQVLLDALELRRVPPAIAAAEVLGQIGDPSVLYTANGDTGPLALAMYHSDRRVRLAAALACIKLAPGESFPGASRVTDTLGWLTGTSGTSLVLVGHPRGSDAQSLIGYMNELGYDGHAAYIGRGLAEQAFTNPDYEFILVSDAIDLPPVKELVQWLRRDYRTARIPVGVMARGEQLEDIRYAFADDPFTTVFPRLHSTDIAAIEEAKLRAVAGRNLVSRDERIEQARAALAALALLAANEANYARYDLLRQEPAIIRALNNPALTAEAANILAHFATPNSQSALIEFASQHTRLLADRQLAAAAFARAVEKRGLRLTQQQIVAQYDRYNLSETLDKPTQELLGSILDAIEAPAIARGALTKVE